MAVERWSWLGDHLAVDLANTVRRRGMRYVELLGTPADLAGWLDREADRLGPAPTPVSADLLARVLELRDATLALLRAAATGADLPTADRDRLNDVVTRHPTVRLVGAAAGTATTRVPGAGDPADALVARLAAATVDLLARPDLAGIALCDAPGCGQLYHRTRSNQQWCGPHCGARARAERQHRAQ